MALVAGAVCLQPGLQDDIARTAERTTTSAEGLFLVLKT